MTGFLLPWFLGFGMGVGVAVLALWSVSMRWLPRQTGRREPTAIRAVTPDELIEQRVGRDTRR
jgi:hypothetical protein